MTNEEQYIAWICPLCMKEYRNYQYLCTICDKEGYYSVLEKRIVTILDNKKSYEVWVYHDQ